MAAFDHQKFAWMRIRDLFGLPYGDERVEDLFARAALRPDDLWHEVRVGIESMPPHDKQPCSLAEIDLTPSYRVRLRFKHAQTVMGAAAGVSPTTFVFAGVAYFLDADAGRQPFSAGLPDAIRPTDDLAGTLARVGTPPTGGDYAGPDDTVFAVWEDRNPILHVLFGEEPKRPIKVTVFLAASPADSD